MVAWMLCPSLEERCRSRQNDTIVHYFFYIREERKRGIISYPSYRMLAHAGIICTWTNFIIHNAIGDPKLRLSSSSKKAAASCVDIRKSLNEAFVASTDAISIEKLVREVSIRGLLVGDA